jgi:subtilisin family serine protease
VRAGGRGDGFQVFDIESGWSKNHEDLQINWPSDLNQNDTRSTSNGSTFHGTATAGVIGGDTNGFGIEGIAPNAQYHMAGLYFDNSFRTYSGARAIQSVISRARRGDVILLEQQRYWRAPSMIVLRGPLGPPLLPIEWWPQDFDAIRVAVDRGLIVVEAAGNGYQDLNSVPLDTSRFIFRNDPNIVLPGDNDTLSCKFLPWQY